MMKDNLSKAQAFFDAYTAHDIAAMVSLCSPNGSLRYVPLGEQGVGSLHEVGAGLWQMYVDAFPDFRAKVVSMIEAQGEIVVCETINSGSQAKDIGSVKNKGRSFAAPHSFILAFGEDGLIEKVTAFWDNDTIFAQLGHTEQHK